jgi:hypothetical protein
MYELGIRGYYEINYDFWDFMKAEYMMLSTHIYLCTYYELMNVKTKCVG